MSISRLLKNKCGESSEEIPNIFHILSTLKSLNTLEAEGGKREAIRRHKLLASFCRKEIKKMGLKLMSNAPHFSNSVTPIILPQGISAPELRKKMEELYGISIAGAQSDYWKVRMVRIGHLGYVYKNDLARCLRAFRIVIKELNEGN